MNIIILKLISGEEVITELIETNPNLVVAARPRVLTFSPNGAGLVPYIMSDPDNRNVSIDRKAIVAELVAPKEISDAYLKAVTNIQLMG